MDFLKSALSEPEGLLSLTVAGGVVLFLLLTLFSSVRLYKVFSSPIGLLLFPILGFVAFFAVLCTVIGFLPKEDVSNVWSVLGSAGSLLSGLGSLLVAAALGTSFLGLILQKNTHEEEATDQRWYTLIERLPTLSLAKHELRDGDGDLDLWFSRSVALLSSHVEDPMTQSRTGEALRTDIARYVIDQSISDFSPGLVETLSALAALRHKARVPQRRFLDDSLAAFASQRIVFCAIFESIAKRRWQAVELLSVSGVATAHLGIAHDAIVLLNRIVDMIDDRSNALSQAK